MWFFARMNGDENEECMELLRQMNVTKVPIFLFIWDYKIRGRYVGSGRGELLGEILRYQGVRVTYQLLYGLSDYENGYGFLFTFSAKKNIYRKDIDFCDIKAKVEMLFNLIQGGKTLSP